MAKIKPPVKVVIELSRGIGSEGILSIDVIDQNGQVVPHEEVSFCGDNLDGCGDNYAHENTPCPKCKKINKRYESHNNGAVTYVCRECSTMFVVVLYASNGENYIDD